MTTPAAPAAKPDPKPDSRPEAWSDAELLTLLALRAAGFSQSQIALRVGRTRNAVQGALARIDQDYAMSCGKGDVR